MWITYHVSLSSASVIWYQLKSGDILCCWESNRRPCTGVLCTLAYDKEITISSVLFKTMIPLNDDDEDDNEDASDGDV